MLSKKGQGQIIVTVLTILIVIVAISIVSFFIMKFVRQKATEADVLASPNLNVYIHQALYNEDNQSVYVTVGRNPGKGNLS